MQVTCWSDYLCPWCYVGQDRSRQLQAMGLDVVHRPFELHPEIGPAGRSVRPDGRMAPTFARVAAECERAGLAFRAPTRMPNTHRALVTAEWVRVNEPTAADRLHAALFDAHFARGLALDDPTVLDALVDEAGASTQDVRAAVDAGVADALLVASMAEARAVGATSTPTWVLPDGFALPGAIDPVTLQRWVSKIVARVDATASTPSA